MEKKKAKVIKFRASKAPTYNADAERANNAIGIRIDEEIRLRGLSRRDVCSILESYGLKVSANAICKWVIGAGIPNAYQLIALCHALEIDDGLSTFSMNFKPPLNAEGIQKVKTYREDLIASGNYRPQPKASSKIRYVEMPVSNLAVSAGTGAFLDEGNFDMVSFPENTVPDHADFGIRVSGNSMEPVYHDGQIVWVHQCSEIAPGQVGIFVVDGEGFLKMYDEQVPEEKFAEEFTDSYGAMRMQPVLVSYNQAYPNRVISPNSSFQIVGRAL